MAHHDPIGLIAPHAGLAQLNERSRDIFRQIVESYLATGEPVGSRNISRLIAMPLSPASVRNVMSDLEQLGLIYAPHTSAGRLPTELGLRFFVDALMQVGDLTEPERESIQNQLASVGKAQSVEAALGEALTRLSGLTRAAAVVLTAKSNSRLKHIEFVRLEPERALVVPADVADAASVQSLFDTATQTFGRVDLLFNNAGTGAPAVALEDLTVEQWKQVVDVNLNGMFYCIQSAFRAMKSQQPMGGRIINNGSISATTPRPNSIAYCATKHAVTGLTKTASLDGRKYDIAVGQIDIGNAATEMATRMATGILQANGQIAVEPLMDVAIIGQSIVYMANLPLQANVMFHTVMATKMPFAGRG